MKSKQFFFTGVNIY